MKSFRSFDEAVNGACIFTINFIVLLGSYAIPTVVVYVVVTSIF